MRFVVAISIGFFAACSNGAPHPISGSCHGLALGECRTTDGCVPDICEGCICALNYRGCLATGEVPAMCPALGCPSGICCTDEMACEPNAGQCTPPGTSFGCGACNSEPSDCANDGECMARGAHMICEPITCSCQGNTACVGGCTSDDACGEGTRCDLPSARCVARTCISEACPPNFTCGNVTCFRTTCTEDLDCDGYCIDGQCYAERGQCMLPVP